MLAGHVHVESLIFCFYHRKNKLQQLSKLEFKPVAHVFRHKDIELKLMGATSSENQGTFV